MDKREKEMHTVYEMIHLYCRKNHKDKELCSECLALYEYAKMRIEKCPFMETKTFCSQCKVHCYKLDKREKIRINDNLNMYINDYLRMYTSDYALI